MPKITDVRPVSVELYFLPVLARIPLKFGPETLTSVTCARVRMEVADSKGQRAGGWGETPLSVQWVWPSVRAYEMRHEAMKQFCLQLGAAWARFNTAGHPLEVGHAFLEKQLPVLWKQFNKDAIEPMPWLAALVCCSAFDIALHDAFGVLHNVSTYDTYQERFMSADLSHFLQAEEGTGISFAAKFPKHFLNSTRPEKLTAWHLVGGKDWIDKNEADASAPQDGYPTLLRDWIRRDGLKCLKIKLRGNDPKWDYDRILQVGMIAVEGAILWLSIDFNCTVTDPRYVITILDRLLQEAPRLYGMILYLEQPFPYDLEHHQIDVHAVSARKPLFMDESAHDWKLIRLGRKLGWTGVALKTCKTQTGAILSLCWAKAHGMTLMVQDLTNPMLAQIPHVLLASHAGTIMGVETNCMQFYPDASAIEAKVHPGLYQRHQGDISLGSIHGPGFGYRVDEIKRPLPKAIAKF